MSSRPAILRAVVQNQAVRVPGLANLAQRSHRTGVQSDAAAGREMFEILSDLSPVPIPGARVLELGPGKGTALMEHAAGVVSTYAAVDTVAYLGSPAELASKGVDYRITDGHTIPWPDASFDVVWSNSVLEHVRAPRAMLAETLRVLRPGGAMVAEIDLADHQQDRSRADGIYACLAHSDRLWDLMSSHRSSWVNRLRASEWRALVDELGYEVVTWRPRLTDIPLSELRKLPYLDRFADDDLTTRLLHVAALRRD